MIKSAKCDGITLKSMVMNITFLLVTFLILEQANGKKRVVIHVPNKINNIHHHHVKKVIVYKPVPVKCHHEEDKHDWQEGWESTQKDEWLDKRPPLPVPVKHPGWPAPELLKGGYMSGERISSDSWDATATAAAAAAAASASASVATLKDSRPPPPSPQLRPRPQPQPFLDIEEEDEFAYQPFPTKKRSPSASVDNPSGWKVWSPSDVTHVAPGKSPSEGGRLKVHGSRPVVQAPKEHIVTYKVVKKKVTKERAKKIPNSSTELWSDYKRNQVGQSGSWSDTQEIKSKPKSRPKTHYHSYQGKGTHYVPTASDDTHPPSYEQDLYGAGSSIKPQDYPKPQHNADLRLNSVHNPYAGSSNNVVSHSMLSPNTYHSYSPASTLQPYYESDAYFTSSIRPSQYTNQVPSPAGHVKSYYDQGDIFSAPRSHAVQTYKDPFTLNPQNIKALLDQNVQTSIDSSRRRPNYDLNIHNSNKARPDSSSYQMRYSHLNSTAPSAYLINH